MTLPMYTFNSTVPASNNDPSIDQPKMLTNNQSENSIWQADHFGFNVNSSGYHQQARMPNRTTYNGTGLSPNPPTVISTFGGIYCDNTSSTTPTNESGLWYTPDNTGNTYQLTRTITGSYALFAKYTNNYNGVGTGLTGGWTFLPGGMLLQYGTYLGTSSGNPGIPSAPPITFPVAFNNAPYNLQITLISTSGGTSSQYVASVVKVTKTNFTWNMTNVPTNAYIGINWMAIGV